ncbi:hypothetical protein CkaCkLH20_00461 [Colletotrichum karsti]|uniref:Kinetochore protein fta4 n=1 Tax=Colletotrichum karsti TaxID=1095194 RepID=A0A9P6IGI0_9PEZI|nr:uncharacterized protein CkaCkLH20_00461 [Colletotrichum karsti]KAF9882425.1 hypothetical protein CkaCkLH20_00461 [Colletotrichum karsti]
MSSNPPKPPQTITSQKQSFLTAQTRLLSQPVRPSRAWLEANAASETPLPDSAVEQPLTRLNHVLSQHCRRAYSHQASRHVAEQIDALYLSHPSSVPEDEPSEGVSRTLDLTDNAAVKSLPASWPVEKDATAYPMEAKRYAEQYERLKSLAEQRQQATERVERLRRMKALLDPFRSDDSGAGVQENLISRDGKMEAELEKMRGLLARVGGRVSLLPDSDDNGSLFRDEEFRAVEPVATGEKRKLDHLLDSF